MTSSPDLNRVTLELPGRTDHLHLVRLNVAAIAGAAFAVEEVEDVKIAVEEMAAAMVGLDPASETLHVEVALEQGVLRVSGRRPTAPGQTIELPEFVATIVDALVDEYSFGASGDEAKFHFTKAIRDR